jgi:hypothetical protein
MTPNAEGHTDGMRLNLKAVALCAVLATALPAGAQTQPATPTAQYSNAQPSNALCSLPPPSFTPKMTALRAQYRDHPLTRPCSKSANELYASIDKGLTPASNDEVMQQARRYVSVCLREDLHQFGSALTDAERAALTDAMVVIGIEQTTGLWCHGLRTGAYVLTANHCLRDAQNNDVRTLLRVRHVSEPKTFRVQVVFEGDAGNQNAARDFTVLKIVEPPAVWRAETSLRVEKPEVAMALIVPQLNAYVWDVFGMNFTSERLDRSVIIEDNPVCYAYAAPGGNGYIFHRCQTEHGTSGTPLFQRQSDGKLALVGLHSGPSEFLSAKIGGACAIEPENYGVTLALIVEPQHTTVRRRSCRR